MNRDVLGPGAETHASTEVFRGPGGAYTAHWTSWAPPPGRATACYLLAVQQLTGPHTVWGLCQWMTCTLPTVGTPSAHTES